MTTWTAALQTSLFIILCHPLLLLPSVFLGIRIFSNESVLCIRWLKYWSFSFSISPSNEYTGLISLGLTGWISLQSKGLSRVFSNTTVQKHQFFGIIYSPIIVQFLLGFTGLISLPSKGFSRVSSNTTAQKHQYFGVQPSLWSNSHIHA